MTRLRLIGLGGTIAFTDSSTGAVPSLSADDLPFSPETGDEISSVDVANISSIGIGQAHLVQLVAEIEKTVKEHCEGVVVSHGTDTMEESVYLAALTVERSQVPIVFTGAMRHHGSRGSDGPANLADAFAVARQGARAGLLGPCVVMNGEVHSARFVAKRHTVRLNAFESPDAGPVGSINEGRASIWFTPTYIDYVGPCPRAEWPDVELVTMVTALNPTRLRPLLARKPDGVVIAGFGGGHAHTAILELIDELVAGGVHVVAASRCGAGDTLRSTYGVPGTEIDLQERGVLMAGTLSPAKARLRLQVALANGVAPPSVFPFED
jgi:L-asparaginase